MDVFMNGAIGDQDDFGDRIVTELKTNKVNTTGIFTIKGEKTGYAHINVDALGTSSVTGRAKANAKCLPGPPLKLDVEPDVVLVQLEISQETVKHVLAWAKGHNAITICNAAPATRTVAPEIFDVDHFILNEEQANKLDGIKTILFNNRSNQRDEIRQHYLTQCAEFHKLGAKCVIITLAELGAVGSVRESGVAKRYIFDAVQVESKKVEDTTGGSDAFIGAYTVEIVHQWQLGMKQDVGSAMEMGIKAAGLCVSRVGSMQGIPTVKEILTTEFRAVDI
jgi:ribokinase